MHVYFSGAGGAGIGPLALIAHQAGYQVSGSDQRHNRYIDYLAIHGVQDIHIGQSYEQIAEVHAKQPIDWFVYTSALPIEHPDAPELRFCREHNIKATKRDDFLNALLEQRQLKLIAIAGTHGKTTTTAMAIWLCKQLGVPVSYSVGAKMSFGDMGEFAPGSEYFVYEADEFDRNFLSFKPFVSLITGLDWDHPDIYPTRAIYDDAFRQFLNQSQSAVMWQSDFDAIKPAAPRDLSVLPDDDPELRSLSLAGEVNRRDALLVARALQPVLGRPLAELIAALNTFPGIGRRFERIAPNVFSDYAHTPPKIRGALQLAHEVAGDRVIVVYEGLHNTRQHFIKDELTHLFDDAAQLYIVPTYLSREDPNLPTLTPSDLQQLLSPETRARSHTAELNDELARTIAEHQQQGDLVLCISAGGGGSLDEWLRQRFAGSETAQAN